MNRRMARRITAVVTSLTLFSTLLPNWTPLQKVQAAESVKAVSLGISQIAAPSKPQDGKSWKGDYVYYGNYQNVPIKWRVLDSTTTGSAGISSEIGGVLLQSDRILEKMPFGDVSAWLGNFGKESFSQQELEEVMTTSGNAGESPNASLQSMGLQGDAIFQLDVADLANANYGYAYKDGVVNAGIEGSWWLRSQSSFSGMEEFLVGSVFSGGMVYYGYVGESNGVVPAFNLDSSNVLFVTAATDEKKDMLKKVGTTEINEWRLTLSEGATLQADEVTRDLDEVSVSYQYTGNSMNQMSVMITNGDYQDDDTEITYYGKVSVEDDIATFTLPEDFDENNDVIYLLAEKVNGARKSDYASEPVELELPPRHEHDWQWQFDEEEHWKECVADDCYLDDDDAIREAGEHDFGNNKPVMNEETGEKEIQCTICGQFIGQADDDPDDGNNDGDGKDEEHEHIWSTDGIVIREATCTETGIMRYYCTVYYDDGDYDDADEEEGEEEDEDDDDKEYRDEVIPALSATRTHTFGEWVEETAPTTEKEGVSKRICSVCNATETKAIPKLPPAHEHAYNTFMSDKSYHWYQCECGEKEEVETHTWNKGKVLNKATKKLEGEVLYTCTVCDATANRTMAKIGTEFESGIYRYQVIAGKGGSPCASLLGFVKGKSAKTVNVAKTVKLQGVKYSVTKIEKRAFFKNKKIQRVVIGNNIEEIGNLAFFSTKNVEKITIGTGVKTLGSHIFCHENKLKQIVIKSKKLKKHPEGIFHGNMKNFVIKVPKKKVKVYQKNVFRSYVQNVKPLKS